MQGKVTRESINHNIMKRKVSRTCALPLTSRAPYHQAKPTQRVPGDRPNIGEGTLPLKLFLSFRDAEDAGVMMSGESGMRCTTEVD